jgi:hypothetical protein
MVTAGDDTVNPFARVKTSWYLPIYADSEFQEITAPSSLT